MKTEELEEKVQGLAKTVDKLVAKIQIAEDMNR